jgi:hypothetical protein
MPDWEKIVSEQLADLRLEDTDRKDVVAELAAHLEETYDALRRRGFPEHSAVEHALAHAGNWKDLQQKIFSARKDNNMTPRAAQLWLPSLVTLVISFAIMILLSFFGLNPGPLSEQGWRHGMYVFSDYTVWLIVLPLVGALGALMSGRAGGTSRSIFVSGVFPALAWLVILVFLLSFSSLCLHNLKTITAPLGPLGVLTALVFAPAACLLIGVLAYFALERRRVTPAG